MVTRLKAQGVQQLRTQREALGGPGGHLEVLDEVALGLEELDVGTVVDDLLLGLEGLVVGSVERGEAPLLGDNDLLSSRELVSRSSEGLNDDVLVRVSASDRHDDLTADDSQHLSGTSLHDVEAKNSHVDSGDTAVRLAPSASHTLLQPIGTSAGQHLVDSDNVEGVNSDTHVERLLAGRLHNVLVGANSGRLESLRRQLLVLVRHQVAAEGEVVNGRLLSAKVIDSDLGIGDTSVVPRLGEPA